VRLLDPPDERRLHVVPTPRLGGVAVLAGAAAALAALGPRPGAAVAWGALAFFAVGLLDDLSRGRRGPPPLAKAALQVAAGGVAAGLGLRFEGVLSGEAGGTWPSFGFGALQAPMTVLWFVAVVNAVNFLDGSDAIVPATSVVVLSAAAGVSTGSVASTALAAAGAVLGFAAWNAPPARIFLGDGGSHLVGFLVAATACSGGGAPAVPWPLVGAALVPAVVDVAMALAHKARTGIPLSQAHHDHLYQRLVKAGRSPASVALRYAALSLAAVVVAGPLALRVGAPVASAIGLAVLAAHLGTGARATRHVPRLARS
jgi:UDP-N-acetylmuramyl pentapeptide phosphotransferase/UDP-N-acetylglucosamine-1-phosphate transferase